MKNGTAAALGAWILIVGCGASTTDVGGVDGGAGSGASSGSSGSGASGGSAGIGGTGGSGASGGSGGTAGSAGSAGSAGAGGTPGCPPDIGSAVGTPCAEEGKFCGGENCGPCGFCNLIQCTGGKWEQVEVFPDPNCTECGGIAGKQCADGYWCDYPPGCGLLDQLGTCKPKPEGCFTDCPGVCACDGQTYCNECEANKAGADVDPTQLGLCAGKTCANDNECTGGLKCCYPCGVPGCQNQCLVPEPNGQCPAFP